MLLLPTADGAPSRPGTAVTPLAIGVAAAAAVVVVVDVGVVVDGDGPLAESMLVRVAEAAVAVGEIRRRGAQYARYAVQ